MRLLLFPRNRTCVQRSKTRFQTVVALVPLGRRAAFRTAVDCLSGTVGGSRDLVGFGKAGRLLVFACLINRNGMVAGLRYLLIYA